VALATPDWRLRRTVIFSRNRINIKNTGKNGQYQTISRKGKIKKLSEGGVKI